ncbi:MAG TPA: acyl-CoA-binding protein [Casimicrobiaceae bacterium]|nr:acyl-CoA-binding protein [Casimicrobiaceae bacterium]
MNDVAAAPERPAAPVAPSSTTPDGVFLVHGLGGTQYDLGSMHKRLKNAGLVTHSLTLPGHGTKPQDLAGVTAEDWIDAVVTKYREVRDQHPKLHVMGMCMGALLSAVLAQREKHAKGNLVMLAPPVFIDGWATPWYRGLRPLLYLVPGIGRTMKIEEEDPFGIKNEQLRAIVKAKFERGENFHYRWVPLECIRQVDRLRAILMKTAKEIRCPTLVVHAREDELTSLRSANFMVEQIGGGRARMVVLEDSYHMVCVDNDREIVARNVLEFFGAAMPGATSALANEPRMTDQALASAVSASLDKLAAGDFSGLRELAIPDLAWVQPGANRMSGAHTGKTFAAFASRITQGHSPRFTAFGTPVWNRGVALVPATLVAAKAAANLESQGALLLAYHGGKLLEARWFADDVDLENAFFGEPEPEAPGASSLDVDFDAAASVSKTLRKAPDNDTLLALYSLYKQATVGDVSGERPGALDMVNRAKFDAWSGRKGTSREDAMKAYVELVAKLRAAEAP